MKTTIVIMSIVTAFLLAVPMVSAEPGAGQGNSWFGLCTAHNANEEGRENGNPEDAPPFERLKKEAEDAGHDSIEEFCDTVPHPGGNGGPGNGGPGNGGPPEGIPNGPPS